MASLPVAATRLPFRDRHSSSSQMRHDAAVRDRPGCSSIVCCIRAIIASSICCPPILMAGESAQSQTPVFSKKMWDTLKAKPGAPYSYWRRCLSSQSGNGCELLERADTVCRPTAESLSHFDPTSLPRWQATELDSHPSLLPVVRDY